MSPATWAVIDLDALRFNLQIVKALAAGSKVMAVIKANGYGHGLCEVAAALKQADAFAVARVTEGIELREAGFRQRIIVLEGFSNREEFALHCQFQLEPVIHTEQQLPILASHSLKLLHSWLKVDTGMHRLGIAPELFRTVYEKLSQYSSLSVMTHLACADELDNPMTIEQQKLFNEVIDNRSLESSIANSAAIMKWPELRGEWVRPGIMLYGVSPFEGESGGTLGLKPVMSLYSKLISIKTVKKGERIGYGGSYLCQRDSQIGVIAMGYGDGFPRQVKSGHKVILKGQKFPLVGRVSMDMITVDLTDSIEVQIGDTCQLWGAGLPVETIADSADTIGYTVLCGVTQRVKKIYKSHDV